MIFKGKAIVKEVANKGTYSYQVIEDIMDFKKGNCIIIASMDPDYSILLSQISIIIAEGGSPLAHLAIIAREYNKTIILIDNIINKIPKEGRLIVSYKNENGKVEIH